jgi:glutamate synthase (ferredoxin)
MSGGTAFVYDPDNNFVNGLCNTETIEFEPIVKEEAETLKRLIENHVKYTQSEKGSALLVDWKNSLKDFIKVMPIEYKRALKRLKNESQLVENLTT